MKRSLVLGVVSAALALGLANTGCKKNAADAPAPDQSPGQSPGPNPDGPSPAPGRTPGGGSPVNPQPRESRKADFKLDLDGFVSRLPGKQAPDPAWEAKRGKVAEVAGVIATPGLRTSKHDAITVRAASGSKGEAGSVYCVLRDRADWRELAPGRTVRLVGVFDQAKLFGSASYQLNDCTVLSAAGKSDCPEVTADHILKEYAARSPAFKELARDPGRYYFVTGRLVSATSIGTSSDGTKLYLFAFASPKATTRLEVGIRNPGAVEADAVKHSQTVVILAHFAPRAAEFPPTGLSMNGVYVGKVK